MPPTSRRRPLWWLGVGSLLLGLGLLGFVGWQLWGTNLVSERHQKAAVERLERSWHEGAAVPGDGGAESQPPRPGVPTALIRIPRFGTDYVMPVLAGIGDDSLSRGFGHFSGTAGPGERGNYAVAAHRVTHGEPLRGMPDLRPGDRVLVETRDAVHTYEIDTDPNALVVPFDQVWVLEADPQNPDPGGVEPAAADRLLTLTTCAELFHTDDRMIAFGHLVRTREK